MRDNTIQMSVLNALKERGYIGRIVSIEHISELRNDLEFPYKSGLLDHALYQTELDTFDFKKPDIYSWARSVIIAAASQPHVRVVFNRNREEWPCLIPSNYSFKTDENVKDRLEAILNPRGYRVEKARLPLKPLAVRSGIARYGRNNLTYVNGMGSYHRLVAFYSDLHVEDDYWNNFMMMDECESCQACKNACPTSAISSERFLIQAERCITFFSEHPGDFPACFDKAWHPNLVGCLRCQQICPVDRKIGIQTVNGPSFSSQETKMLLNGPSEAKLPRELLDKLQELDMVVYLDVLGRNLATLFSIMTEV